MSLWYSRRLDDSRPLLPAARFPRLVAEFV
jgi:hypothetical protein